MPIEFTKEWKPLPSGDLSFQIPDVLECFDFQEVHHAMQKLDWCWAPNIESLPDAQLGLPRLEDIKHTATRLLKLVSRPLTEKEEWLSVESGGFVAFRDHFTLTLSFEITSSQYEYPDADDGLDIYKD